jgi:hypothetical protein
MIKRNISIFSVFLLLAGIIPTFASASTLTNLALNKTVISGTGSFCNSSSETAAQAVDGNTGTKWCHSGADWLRVDLGNTYNVSEFILTNNSENGGYITKDYYIETSTDGSTWTTAVNVTNNTTIVVTSDITPVIARYVKLNVINPTQGGAGVLRINEFAVKGDPLALVNAKTPSINTQPTGVTVNKGDSNPMLSVAASLSDGGTLTYQWYSNTTNSNSGGSAIIEATNTSYAAPTNTAGMTYYYVVVTNTNNSVTGSKTAFATSIAALVNIKEVPTGSIIIAGGASAINTATVSLSLTRSGTDVTKMRFSDNGQTWSDWENFSATKSYTMPSGDGLKMIYMELQNTDGNVNTAVITNSILLDTIAPDAPVLTPSTIQPTSQEVTVTIEYSSDTVVKQYQMWGDNPATYTGPLVLTGNRNISAYAYDAAGNKSEAVIFITNIDKTPPTVTALIDNGALWTKQAEVMLTLDDGGSGAVLMRFSNDNVNWSNWEAYSGSKSYTLPSGEGLKTLYMQFQDIFENISQVLSKTITLDMTAPVITLDSFNGTTPTNNNITVSATTNEGALNAANHTFSANGSFDFVATDAAGNITTQTVTITNIDKVAPATTDTITINNSTKYVTINLNAVDNGTGIVTSFYTMDGVQKSGNLISLNKQGSHLITFWSVDAAGNIEALNSKEVKVEILQMDSNGQFHIEDIVNLIQHGTIQQQDMNGDSIFDSEDLQIMLETITPIS